MRKLRTQAIGFALLLFSLQFMACSTSKTAHIQERLILGKWVVESVDVGGENVPAHLFGGEIRFQFNTDGTAIFTTPDGQTEQGRYAVRSGKIFDPDSPHDEPVDILHLTSNQLVISMVEQGEMMKMTLRPNTMK